MKSLLSIGAGTFLSIFATAQAQSITTDDKLAVDPGALQARYAGVRVYQSDEGGLAVFGSPMKAGATAAAAADAWIVESAPALSVAPDDLRLIGARRLGGSDRIVFAYQQTIDGIPVEHGIARVLVSGAGRDSRVLYAAAGLTSRPAAGFARDTIDGPAALRSIQWSKAYSHLQLWSAPRLVIYTGERAGTVRAWKFSASKPLPEADEAYTFFVSAATGRLIEARDEIHDASFSGRVFGFASAGTLPDTPANPPQLVPLGKLTVSSEASDESETDDFGFFFFDSPSTTPLNLSVAPAGPFAAAINGGGPTLFRTVPAYPENAVEFILNQQVDEFSVAQINGFIHANLAHDFYASRQPDFALIDHQVNVVVNLPGQCNAFFNTVTQSINTFRAGVCVNTAYSSVVAHEYAHFIVDRLGLRQGAFGEGFADALSMLAYDDPIVGRDFAGPGTFVRDPAAAAQQYPCCCEVHDCGQVLGGVWWNINENLQTSLGAAQGLETARQLFTDWSQITIGIRRGFNSATPLTAIEVLTADDDDGQVLSGTPHHAEICDAFAEHGIACPGGCEQIEDLTATCRRGRVRATITGASGTVWNLTLNGRSAKSTTLSALGRGSVTWRATSGEYEVCVDGCDLCTTATCGAD